MAKIFRHNFYFIQNCTFLARQFSLKWWLKIHFSEYLFRWIFEHLFEEHEWEWRRFRRISFPILENFGAGDNVLSQWRIIFPEKNYTGDNLLSDWCIEFGCSDLSEFWQMTFLPGDWMNNIYPHPQRQIAISTFHNFRSQDWVNMIQGSRRLLSTKTILKCRIFIQHASSPELEPESRYCQNGRFPRESY